MGYLIDSDVLIAAERGRFSLPDLANELREEPLAMAAITASELLHGVHRASNEARRRERARFVEYLLELFPVMAFDLEVARVHAELWASLERSGRMIGAHDLQIAATARMLGYGVITGNEREFRTISELAVLNPMP